MTTETTTTTEGRSFERPVGIAPNGLDVAAVNPSKGAKYSPNLYKWLTMRSRKHHAWTSRVYRDGGGVLMIGENALTLDPRDVALQLAEMGLGKTVDIVAKGEGGELSFGTSICVGQGTKGTLTTILTYHAVAGKVTAADLITLINDNGGTATITTVAGGTLTAALEGGNVVITDAKGGKTTVVKADVMTSNGVIHVTDGVFLPA